jgi:hypothetical protein
MLTFQSGLPGAWLPEETALIVNMNHKQLLPKRRPPSAIESEPNLLRTLSILRCLVSAENSTWHHTHAEDEGELSDCSISHER